MERAALEAVLAATGRAETSGAFTFLCDPRWTADERARVNRLKAVASVLSEDVIDGWLCIPTGGSTGGLRFARHDEQTLSAAVKGFCTFFDLPRVNVIDVLPGFHVSGLMARVRSAATGGRHVSIDWKSLDSGQLPQLGTEADGWVISLVPTQLQRLLDSPSACEWLRAFRIIFVGGGPTWPELERKAAAAALPISRTYGMTETAAMIAASRVGASSGIGDTGLVALPHASVALSEAGTIRVRSSSLYRGYFPDSLTVEEFETHDLGSIDRNGCIHILGRRDSAIITGGKKVQPEEVEAALQASGCFSDVAVAGLPDREWGETVVAFYEAQESQPDLNKLEAFLADRLAAFKRPKRYVAVSDWPRNAQGKLNRAKLLADQRPT